MYIIELNDVHQFNNTLIIGDINVQKQHFSCQDLWIDRINYCKW